MLDNPQNKLNKQVSSNQQQSNSFNNKPPAFSTQADGKAIKPNSMKTEVKDTIPSSTVKNPKDNSTETVPAQQPGFWAKLKQKVANKAKDELMSRMTGQQPDQKQANTDTSSRPTPNHPSPNVPTAGQPRPNIPKTPSGAIRRPTVPKTPGTPKMPKLKR